MSKEQKSYRNEVEPTTRLCDDYGRQRIIQEHPSYAKVSITHPRGGGVEMFGSDLHHNERVCLTVEAAYEETSFGVPNYNSQRSGRIIQLEMTAHQWAGLVSSHSGNGVPCTLTYVAPEGKGKMPSIKGQSSSECQSEKELHSLLTSLVTQHSEGVVSLHELVAAGKANKKQLQSVLEKVLAIHNKLPEITAYALENYKENAEIVKARANAEVEGMLNNLIVRTGYKALGMNTLALEDKGDD